MTRRIFAALLCALALSPAAAQQPRATVVILVRHAEKAALPADDPPLSRAGAARALALAETLKDASVTAAIVTPLTRTQETARPLATLRNVNLEVVPLGPANVHAAAVADAVRKHAGQTVLVVGHSNTIGAILFALGGPPVPDICDSQYSDIYTLILDGTAVRVLHSKYGAPSPDPAATCAAAMKP